MRTVKNDLLKRTVKEFLKINNPHFKADFAEEQISEELEKIKDTSNKNKLGISISKDAYLEIVTSRNRNLIEPHEQKKTF